MPFSQCLNFNISLSQIDCVLTPNILSRTVFDHCQPLPAIPLICLHNLFGWGTEVYVQNWLEPSNGISQRFCLTRESTLTSQDYSPSSVVYIPERVYVQNWLEPSGSIYYRYKRNRLLWLRVNFRQCSTENSTQLFQRVSNLVTKIYWCLSSKFICCFLAKHWQFNAYPAISNHWESK